MVQASAGRKRQARRRTLSWPNEEWPAAQSDVTAAEWGPLRITVNAAAPMGLSDAFSTWYEGLSAAEKDRYLEGVPLRRIGDAENDIGATVAFL